MPGRHYIKKVQKTAYWALRTYFGKYQLKSTKRCTWEVTLHVLKITTTE